MTRNPVAGFIFAFLACCPIALGAATCEPKTIRLFLQNPASNAVLLEGAPVAFSVSVLDDCGTPLTSVNATKVQLTFSDGEPELPLTHVGRGLFTAVWTPRQTGLVKFSVFAFLIRNSTQLAARSDGATVRVIEHAPTPTLQSDTDVVTVVLPQSSQPVSRSIRISNPSAEDITFASAVLQTPGENWLSVSSGSNKLPAFSTAPVDLVITPGSLLADAYKATVQLTYPGGPPLLVRVRLNVSQGQSILLLDQSSLSFQAVGAVVEPPQQVSILALGASPIPWTVAASTLSGKGWLQVSRAQGTSTPGDPAPPQVTISVDPTGLPTGEHYGRVTISAPGVPNSPQVVTVLLRVLKPGSAPSPVVRPTGLVFVSPPGGPDPAPQIITVYRFDGTPPALSGFSSTDDGGSWLADPATPSPSSSAVSLTVQASLSSLTTGVRTGAVNVVSGNFTARVPVVSIVGSQTGKSAERQAGGCSVNSLQITPMSMLDGGDVTVAQSSELKVKVTDNCGATVTTGGVGVSFSTKEPTATLTPVGGGLWGGSWTPSNTTQPTCLMSISAVTLVGLTPYFGQLDLTVNMNKGLNRPQIAPGAVYNAADFQSDGTAAPGSLITIFGSNLAAGAMQATTPVLPQMLGDTQVQLGGRTLPLLYASDGQVNAQIPYDAPSDVPLQLSVIRNTTISTPEPLSIAGIQPAIFSISGNGQGQGAIVEAVGNTLADATHAVKAGDIIAIFCTGLGAVTSPIDPGAPTPTDHLITTTNPVSVNVGGTAAQVNFSGLAPGFVGLYQVNAVIPAASAKGLAIPVTITSGNRTSPPVTISIH